MIDIETTLRQSIRSTSRATGDWDALLDVVNTRHRREQAVMRVAIAMFVVVAAGAVVLAVPNRGSSELTPAEGGSEGVMGVGAAGVLAVVLAALLLVAAVFALRRRVIDPTPLAGLRRFWSLAVLVPVLYGAITLTTGIGSWPAAAAKWFTVPSLPILLWFVAERVVEHPQRWRTLAATWATLGLGVVFAAVARIDDVLMLDQSPQAASWWRLWPGRPGIHAYTGSLERTLGDIYTARNIVLIEAGAVVAIAVLAAILFRVGVGRHPSLVTAIVAFGTWFALLTYSFLTPWGLILDYDTFVGDAVLASVFTELLLPFGPVDRFSSAALGVAALSMGVLVTVWGGPVRSKTSYTSTPASWSDSS